MDRNRDPFHSSEASELMQHHWQGNFCFQTSQWSAYAEVDAVTKGQVTIGLALDIKTIGIRKSGWITIG
jgi:hypothetical protein